MPFTPYHLGAGALVKSIAPRHFSFTAFAVSNVLIDVEPLVRMLGILDDTILHGPTHTFPGAVVLAALTLPAIRLWDRTAAALHLNGLRPSAVPTWMVLTSALIGTVSHVLLDSRMHADMAAVRAMVGDPTARDLPPAAVEWLCVQFAWYALLIYLAQLTWRGGRWLWRRISAVRQKDRSHADSDIPEFRRGPTNPSDDPGSNILSK